MSGAINLNYVPAEAIGYGRVGVKLAEELRRRDVEVFETMPVPEGVTWDFTCEQGRPSGTAGTVCWVSVPTHALGHYSSQHTAMFTMYETRHLPESFRETFHQFDTLIVPSQQNVEMFSEYHGNVRLAHLGVDPAEWFFVERQQPEVFFDFLISGEGARKGTDLAHKAFLAAFTGDEDPIPRLVMKSMNGEGYRSDRVLEIAQRLDPAEEQALYASCHAYVQPARGEGFGLRPLQAMAQGIPTILTDAHGHESFAHLGHGVSATPAESAYFIWGQSGDWWEPSFDELVEQYRYVYENWGLACEKARKASQVVAQDFTWSNTTDAFLGALDLSRPFAGGEWVTPDPKLYAVRVVKDIELDVGNFHYSLKRGQSYNLLADVKRVLAEAGYLHSDCVGDDQGLTAAQVARLSGSDDHLYCDSCQQRLGSGRTRSDDLFDELELAANAGALA